jgi:hypothetical protein
MVMKEFIVCVIKILGSFSVAIAFSKSVSNIIRLDELILPWLADGDVVVVGWFLTTFA